MNSLSSTNSKLYSVLNSTGLNDKPHTDLHSPFKHISSSRSVTNPPILLNAIKPVTDTFSFPSSLTTDAANNDTQNLDQQLPKTKSTLLEPVKLRKRTKTNVATFHLQTQLLDALATPYYDPSWTALIQRAGAVTSIPTINTSASTVDLMSMRNSAPVFSSAAGILHPLSSKYTSNQAVFTSSAQEPYVILASNDISCLVFGMSKTEIRHQQIVDIVGVGYKDLVLEKARTVP